MPPSRIGYRPPPPPPPPVRTRPQGNEARPQGTQARQQGTGTQGTQGTQGTHSRVQTQAQGEVQRPTHNLVSGESSFQAGGARAETTGTGPGGVETRAHVQGPSLEANASVNADIGLSGIDVNLDVSIDATAVEAGAGATKRVEFEIAGEQYAVELDLEAMGRIGADGQISLDLHVGTDGQLSINASAEGFAGAQASLTGSVRLEHEGNQLAEASITASASAGVSGSAHADIGLNNGSLEFDVGVEATAGLGLGVEISGSVNPGNVLAAVGETAAAAGGEVLENVAEGAINAGGAVVDAAGDAFSSAVDGLSDFAGGVADTVGGWFD